MKVLSKESFPSQLNTGYHATNKVSVAAFFLHEDT